MREATYEIRLNILHMFHQQAPPMTVRQMFYALSVRGAVDKTEAGYRKAQYHLSEMRRSGAVPFGWVADNTRSFYKLDSYNGLGAALERMQNFYRRDLWADVPVHVEIWIEKDALAGVVRPVTEEYDVHLMVARGFTSMSYAYDAAEAIKAIGKPTYVYHFGDFDPSGVAAAYDICKKIRGHGADIHFERVAVLEEQIEAWNLPTRPTKKSDPRAAKWGDKPSVELDAVSASRLRQLVRECIEQHVDSYTLRQLREIEKQERQTLVHIAEHWARG